MMTKIFLILLSIFYRLSCFVEIFAYLKWNITIFKRNFFNDGFSAEFCADVVVSIEDDHWSRNSFS